MILAKKKDEQSSSILFYDLRLERLKLNQKTDVFPHSGRERANQREQFPSTASSPMWPRARLVVKPRKNWGLPHMHAEKNYHQDKDVVLAVQKKIIGCSETQT